MAKPQSKEESKFHHAEELHPGIELSKEEALNYIIWKFHQKGMVKRKLTEEELEEQRREDEILKEFGI